MTYAPSTQGDSKALAVAEEQHARKSLTLLSKAFDKNLPQALTTEEIVRRIDSGDTMPLAYHNRYNADMLNKEIAIQLISIYDCDGIDGQTALRYAKIMLPLIKRKYGHLTPEDIRLFAERAIMREYGKLYGRLTPSVLMEWLDTYSIRRFDDIEVMAQKEHYKHKGTPNHSPQDTDKYWRELKQRINK